MNILFTSIGRRVELIQEFLKARKRLGIDVQIIGGDLSVTAPALYFCDTKVTLKPICDPEYIESLLQICSEYKVDLLIPTIDTDLFLLSNAKDTFGRAGTKVLISDPDRIRICRDKRDTVRFLLECGLKTPIPVDEVSKYSADFPCFIKPLDGSSSIDAYKIETRDELRAQAACMKNYIIQPFINGTEYTVDIFCDFNSEPLIISPRERIATRSGEVLKTKMCNDHKIISECNALIKAFKPVGAITVQLIREKNTGDDYFIEINPRFGGGAPLSMKAGANSAEVLLLLLVGQKVEQRFAQNDLVYSRFDQSICINELKQYKAIVFDLDDTLYSEKDYVRSGFRAVESYLKTHNLGIETGLLWTLFCNKEGSPIDKMLLQEGVFSIELRDACLNEYRKHIPDIRLYDGLRDAIVEMKGRGIVTAILTNGRPVGQHAKIDALNIKEMFNEIVITDELGGDYCRKPSDVGFRFLQSKLKIPFEQMVYIGDNPSIDFIAPDHLGMGHLYFCNPDGLYSGTSREAITTVNDLIEAVYTLTI